MKDEPVFTDFQNNNGVIKEYLIKIKLQDSSIL
jgi:hypothetical protein